MPRVEIVQKHNTAARRLYIRGHNGKIYPYLVMNDACLTESRREERVLQLLRLLNPCLEKRKETTKRHLFFTGTAAATNQTQIFPGSACAVLNCLSTYTCRQPCPVIAFHLEQALPLEQHVQLNIVQLKLGSTLLHSICF